MSKIQTIRILSVLGAREWIRLKFFYLVIFFSIVFILFSHLLSSLTFTVQERLLFDFGLAGLEIGLIFISSLIGTHAIQREIDRKTLLVILARPIPRWHIVLGAWGTVFLLNLIFTLGFGAALFLTSRSQSYFAGFAFSLYGCLLKSFVISSFALAFGIMVRPMLALGASVCYWILCYSIPDIKFFVKKINDDFLIGLVDVVDKVTPNFYLYNWKTYYYVVTPALIHEVLWATTHTFAWTLFWLFVACMFFRRKEIV